MGIETLILGGLSALSAVSSMNAAQKQAQSIAEEGNIATKNLAKKVRYAAGEQTVAFLQSGVSLDGTPDDVIQGTFNTGLEDINLLAKNYNNKSKAAISAGRSQAIGSLVKGFAGASFGGDMMGSFKDSFFSGLGKAGGAVGAGSTAIGDSIGFGMNNAGYGMDAYTFLDG